MKKKLEELRALSELELDAKVVDLRKENFELKGAIMKKEDVKKHQIVKNKRDIARLLTIKGERQKA